MGTRGAVQLPEHITDAHKGLIGSSSSWGAFPSGRDLQSALVAALAISNPYSNTATKRIAYDPENATATGVVDFSEAHDPVVAAQDEIPDVAADNPIATDIWNVLRGRATLLNEIDITPISLAKYQSEGTGVAGSIAGQISSMVKGLAEPKDLWEEIAQKVASRLNGVIGAGAVSGLIGSARGSAAATLSTAISASIRDNSAVTSAIDTFQRRQEAARDGAFGRIENEAAAIGSANSSATQFAKALVQKDVTDAITDFAAQIKIQILQSALGAFAQFESSYVNASSIASQFVSSSAGVAAQLHGLQEQFRSTLVQLYSSLVGGYISEGVRKDLTQQQIKTEQRGFARQAEIQAVEVQSGYLRTMSPLRFQKTEALLQRHQMKLATYQLAADVKRMRFLLNDEFYKAGMEIETNRIKHPIDLLNFGADIIGRSTSGGVYTPPQVSRASSTLGGAVSGVAAAAAFGASAPLTAGIAIAGALAGALR